MKQLLLPLLAAAALLAPPAQAAVPMPVGATYAKGVPLTVAGYSGSALQNFPVLVRLAENSPAGFHYADLHSPTNGADLCFVDAVGAGLPFEIDTWDTNGTSFVWVRLPSMSSGTKFHMCWGSDTPGADVCGDSPWSDFVGVWHMNETNAAVTTIYDSTTNHLDGTTVATSSSTDGKVGRARFITSNTTNTAGKPYDSGVTIDMTGDAAKLGVVDAVIPEFTASFWVRPQNNAQWWYFITRKASDKGPGWGLQNGSEGNNASFKVFRAYGGAEDDTSCMNLTGIDVLAKQQWTKLDAVWMADKTFTLYTNGVPAGTGTLKNLATNGDQTKLALGGAMGPTSNSKNGRGVYGDMDEIRLRKGALSPDWLAADYATQANASFLTPGSVETPTVASGPIAILSPSSVEYTNATVVVTVVSLGGGSSMDVDVELSTADDFTTGLRTNSVSVSGPGDTAVPFAGLAFGTTYYARALLDNHVDAPVATDATSLTTATPGTPAVSAQVAAVGFSGFSANALPTEIGTGGEKVALWLDVSAAGDFTDAVSFGGIETNAVPASVPIAATGLANGTNYAVRVRAANVWGLSAVSPTLSVTTRTEPVEMSSPTALYAGNGVETLGISAVDLEPGATYSVALSVDGAQVRTWSGLSATGEFSANWSGREGSAHTAVFSVSSSLDARGWTREYTMPFTVGSTVAAIGSAAALDSMILRVGDAVTLPALGPRQRLAYDTNAVVSVVGTVFTALEPGACRVRVFSTDAVSGETSLSDSGVLIVAPAVTDVKGGLFVNRTAVSGTVKWCNAASWQKISGAEGHDWPDGPDDIALVYLPLEGYTVTFDLENHDIVLGYLGAGSTHENKILYISNGGITFQTSDGSESWLRFSGRTGGNGELSFNAKVPITLANDLVLDGVGQDVMRATFNGPIHIGDHTLRTDRVPYYGGGDPFPRGQLQLIGDISGTGLFLHEADTTMRANGTKSFTGTWDIRNGRHTGNYGGCGMFLGGCHLAGATELAVRGAWMSDKNTRYGAAVRTGWGNSVQFAATTNYFVEVLPPKVTLDGGYLMLLTEGGMGTASSNPLKKPYEAYLATGIRDDWYVTDEFRIAGGPMGAFASQTTSNHPEQYPNSHSVFTNLVVERGGSASFALNHTLNKGEQFALVTNDFRIVNSPAAAWDSGKGYEILPFFFPNAESNNRNIAVRDTSTGFVTIVTPDSTASSTGNIRELGANGRNDSMQDGATWEAVTVYPGAYGYFAQPNSTVKILSGYLNVVAKPFAPVDHANSASSTVDFGDRPAYVYVNSQNETADIGCRIKGTGGFVKSAGGTLQLYQPMDALTGGVRIGAGRLSLIGDATLGTNDVFVAAGAKLRIACDADPFWQDARLDLEDRAWIATTSKIELDNAVENRVRRLYVSGENWRRGTYGSSASSAEFVDDRIFSGLGILKVKGDDLLKPSLMILR